MLTAPGTPSPPAPLPTRQLCRWCGRMTPTALADWSSQELANYCPRCNRQRIDTPVVAKETRVTPIVLPPPEPRRE